MATAAEEIGYDSVWVMDHFYQLPPMGGPSQPMLDVVHPARCPGDADVAACDWAPWSPASPTATRRIWPRS